MNLKFLVTLFAGTLFLNNADASIRRVGYKGVPLAGVDYADFISAYNAATGGDTIQIYGNINIPTGGNGISIRKKLIIQGFGYNFDIHPNLQATSLDAPSRFLGSVIFSFEPGSEHSVIEGCAIFSDWTLGSLSTFVRIATSNITIRRCYIAVVLETQSQPLDNSRIEGSVVTVLNEFPLGFPSTNTLISNCILNTNINFYKPESTGSIINCVQMPRGFYNYLGYITLNNATFLVKNSIFDYPYDLPAAPNTTWENCFFRSPEPVNKPKGKNNRWGQRYDNLFGALGGMSVIPGQFYKDCSGCSFEPNVMFNEKYFFLKDKSPAINGGLDSKGDSTDVGIFGGDSAYRYKIGGMPAIPSVYKISASSSVATTNPFKVNAGVRSNAGNNITRVEYYIDVDTGYGKAIPLPITPDTVLDNLEIPVNTGRLSPCSHTLYIRAQDASGSWSLVNGYSFQNVYVSPAATPQDFMVQFDGINDYLDLGTWFEQREFTLSFWVKPDSIQVNGAAIAAIQNDLYLYANPTARDNYILAHLLQFDLLPNEWNHVTITMNGATNTRQVYLFGQLIDSNQWNYDPKSGFNLTFGKGGFYPNSYFKGALDEIRLWNMVLPADSVYKNFLLPVKGNEPGLLGYWNFNNGCETTAPDLTINGHSAMLKNGTGKAPSTVPNIGQQVVPNKGGNTGIVTVQIFDKLFKVGATAKLVSLLHPVINADTVTVNSDGRIAICQFNLLGKDTGIYTIVVTNPDSSSKTYPNNFEITNGSAPEVWVKIIGRNVMRSGRPFTFQVAYGNNGNIDAIGVPLWISVPKSATVRLGFEIINPQFSSEVNSLSFPIHYKLDSMTSTYDTANIIPLILAKIPAGTSSFLNLMLDGLPALPNNEIMVWTNAPFNSQAFDCFTAVIGAEADLLTDIGVFGCIKAVLRAYGSLPLIPRPGICPSGDAFDCLKPINPPSQLGPAIANAFWECLPGVSDVFQVAKIIENVLRKLATIGSHAADIYHPCFGPDAQDLSNPNPIGAVDPNEKVGPSKFQSSNAPFNYTIFFENKSSATAAAQDVLIIDTLDKTKFDIATFNFGDIAFGKKVSNTTYLLNKQFVKDIDLRPTKNLILRVEGRVDTVKGIVNWKLTSLDPSTMLLTEDPVLGFLPPNVTSPEGEGWVSFNIRPYDTLPTGTSIKNNAAIIFDYNDPIITNFHENIFDRIPPASKVLNLASEQADSNFVVKWRGSDNLSGIKHYDVYVAVDTGSFNLWKVDFSDTEAIFPGQPNHQYRFFTIATDSAGNVEADKITAEATTSVVGAVTAVPNTPTSVFEFRVLPNPAETGVWFEFTLHSVQQIRLSIFDLIGREIDVVTEGRFAPGTHRIYYDMSHLQSGVYVGQLNGNRDKESIKVFKK